MESQCRCVQKTLFVDDRIGVADDLLETLAVEQVLRIDVAATAGLAVDFSLAESDTNYTYTRILKATERTSLT